jgi:competence protein ComEA
VGELSFSRRPAGVSVSGGQLRVMALLLLGVGGAMIWLRREDRSAPVGPPVAVQVVGAVPSPGWYTPSPPTVHAAVRAAGGEPGGLPEAGLAAGTRLVVEDGAVRLEPSGRELVFDLPLDLNAATPAALEALPGVGPSLAAAIVEAREAAGGFDAVDDLLTARGIGPATLESLRPFVSVGPPPPR